MRFPFQTEETHPVIKREIQHNLRSRFTSVFNLSHYVPKLRIVHCTNVYLEMLCDSVRGCASHLDSSGLICSKSAFSVDSASCKRGGGNYSLKSRTRRSSLSAEAFSAVLPRSVRLCAGGKTRWSGTHRPCLACSCLRSLSGQKERSPRPLG